MKDNNTVYGWRFILAIQHLWVPFEPIKTVLLVPFQPMQGDRYWTKSLLVIDLLSFVECKFGVARTIYFSFQSALHYYFHNTFYIHQLKYVFLFWWMSTLCLQKYKLVSNTTVHPIMPSCKLFYERLLPKSGLSGVQC